ncbi:ATP-binding cassette domain-containing protein [Methanomassiliicoccales archaeon LGM-DZ1]|nr:ATP-binding cassette domain-containing protein [Methanomassiliicoccales archaeon LGM-DZ1]
MDPKNAIEVRHVCKTFRIEVSDPDRKAGRFNRNPTKKVENRVIDDLSLDVRKGEVLGIIGRNGAGKSTLLSMIAKIMEPDSGKIEHSGKVASILELGMGFNQDMSGRENIYLKGELYGFTRKEMEPNVQRIIDYSGIGKYIDNPVRTYSSGMYSRLAFAIMVNVDSDIMLVDEILSVGDESFRKKAQQHFRNLAKSGKTVVFVSHSIRDMEDMCTRVIWIEGGRIFRDGRPRDICAQYEYAMSESPEVISDLAQSGDAESQFRLAMMYRDGSGPFGKDAELYREWIRKASDQGHPQAQVEYGDMLAKEGKDEEAMFLYQSAVNMGNGDAKLRISAAGPQNGFRDELRKAAVAIGQLGDSLDQFRCGDTLLKLALSNDGRREAFDWFVKSAGQGYPPAMHQAAVMCRDGAGIPKDPKKMEAYLTEASGRGFMPSITLLADLYFRGKVIPRDERKAFALYLRGAELGNGNCMYQTAVMMRDGVGTEVDLDGSRKWFSLYSFSSLGWNCIQVADRMRTSGAPDADFMEKCYESAAMQGIAPGAGNAINASLAQGNDEWKQQIERMRFLAENGNADAMRRMGNFYYSGIGVVKDYAEALRWYQSAAMNSDSWSANRVGEMYRDGKGAAEDIAKAAEMFRKASHNGNTVALGNIIDLYASGLSDDRRMFEEAVSALAVIGDEGNIDACNRMGNLYFNGTGVRRDRAKAAEWYEKSARMGDAWARGRVELIRD